MSGAAKQTLAVWKFASCDGCQLSVLDLEDELLTLAEHLQIAYFVEASSASVEGPYDVSLVEGSITTLHDAERIRAIRASSRALVTIGACATAGGIQALRNFADVEEFARVVYASPDYISTLATSTPISAHVNVDFLLEHVSGGTRKATLVFTRLWGIAFFFLLGWNLFAQGTNLYNKHEVSLTLHVPYYPVAYILGVCSFVECLVLVSGLIKILCEVGHE